MPQPYPGRHRAGDADPPETACLTHARVRRISARKDSEPAKGPVRPATALDADREPDGSDVVTGHTVALSVVQGAPPPLDQVRGGPHTGVSGDEAHRLRRAHGSTATLR
ncbi:MULTISPECIES: hypothetical protein [unclassified Streptomyces]|uniref:hypothetical protein n=1 Tax=Streptomyces sp. NPDC055082 TaxID=3365718 RepID=UPI0037D46FF5